MAKMLQDAFLWRRRSRRSFPTRAGPRSSVASSRGRPGAFSSRSLAAPICWWSGRVSKEHARLDEWARELAQSSELRRWFGHDPARFAAFRHRYIDELAAHDARVRELRRRAREGTLTLVYGARYSEHNDAVVLAELLFRGRRSR
jgi:uncharacterized protein YeaO (DUF488 family)